jgi:zinc/manganese transport system substrate-binding protein
MIITTTKTLTIAAVVALLATGCVATGASSGGKIQAVGAENQYTSVISQLGGRYVDATAVMSNPNTDPHTFEASASVASEIASAQLVVQNGLGYDSFMDKIEAATPSSSRVVISAQSVLGLPDSTPNPHLWYKPSAIQAVAKRVTASLAKLQPAHKAYFAARLAQFDHSFATLDSQIAAFKSAHPDVSVATTEPVADYLLEAIGAKNRTPWALQAAIMNDTDPAPQDVATQEALFTGRSVRVFVYNTQVTDSITDTYLRLAKQNDIPVVGVYETMPTDGYDYQRWMVAELNAIDNAIRTGKSTTKL